jgi:hypothetical protein
MPANRGPGGVLRDESLLQVRGSEPREIGSLLMQRQKKAGKVPCATHCALVGVVAQTERDHTPLAEIAMEFVLPEIQLAKFF